MSTTTATSNAWTADDDAAAVRRLEALAREAARRRLQAATQAIALIEIQYQRELARLDEATRRLPDLVLSAPPLPVLHSEEAGDPAAVERHQAILGEVVGVFAERLTVAIADAERRLARRVATAAAWRLATDLEQQAHAQQMVGRAAAERIGLPVPALDQPAKPAATATLEEVEAFVSAWRQALGAIEREVRRVAAQRDARDRAAALQGDDVASRRADEARRQHAERQRQTAQTRLRETIATTLRVAAVSEDDLSIGTKQLLEQALSDADRADYHGSAERWIWREAARCRGVARAFEMMGRAPELVHEAPALSERWSSLVARLQRIANGLEDMDPTVEREHQQLHADVSRFRRTTLARASWIASLCEQGFEVVEREDGDGLVLIDLEHPEAWLEVTELETEADGFTTVLELATDADLPAERAAAVTDSVCQRLAASQQAAGSDVQTETAVIERSRRIKRSRRPRLAGAAVL